MDKNDVREANCIMDEIDSLPNMEEVNQINFCKNSSTHLSVHSYEEEFFSLITGAVKKHRLNLEAKLNKLGIK